jgi:hypothetical protein
VTAALGHVEMGGRSEGACTLASAVSTNRPCPHQLAGLQLHGITTLSLRLQLLGSSFLPLLLQVSTTSKTTAP